MISAFDNRDSFLPLARPGTTAQQFYDTPGQTIWTGPSGPEAIFPIYGRVGGNPRTICGITAVKPLLFFYIPIVSVNHFEKTMCAGDGTVPFLSLNRAGTGRGQYLDANELPFALCGTEAAAQTEHTDIVRNAAALQWARLALNGQLQSQAQRDAVAAVLGGDPHRVVSAGVAGEEAAQGHRQVHGHPGLHAHRRGRDQLRSPLTNTRLPDCLSVARNGALSFEVSAEDGENFSVALANGLRTVAVETVTEDATGASAVRRFVDVSVPARLNRLQGV